MWHSRLGITHAVGCKAWKYIYLEMLCDVLVPKSITG